MLKALCCGGVGMKMWGYMGIRTSTATLYLKGGLGIGGRMYVSSRGGGKMRFKEEERKGEREPNTKRRMDVN